MKLPAPYQRLAIIFFLASSFYFLSSLSQLTMPVFAQNQVVQLNPHLSPNTNPDVPQNLHTWTQNMMIEVMAAMSCQLTGVDPLNPTQHCLGVDATTGKIGFVEGGRGAIGVVGNMIAALYHPPLHTRDYFQYLSQNFGLVKPVLAQGVGYQGLTPLAGIWSAFRNIVYLLFTVIFIIIGLAIMFRVKIDPRTVMTIGNTIPQIIVGIIVVTFSFAIAGLLIDLMYISIYLIFAIFNSIKIFDLSVDLGSLKPTIIQGQNAIETANNLKIWDIIGNATKSVKDIILSMFSGLDWFDKVASVIVGLILAALIGSATNLPFAGALGAGAIAIGGVTIVTGGVIQFSIVLITYLIITVALLWALFRLWFALIISYVSILIDVVMGPFMIALGLLPGSTINVGSWLRDLVANLSAFPATILMFLFGKIFIDAFSLSKGIMFVPPLVGNPGNSQSLGSLIGLGIILMTPQVVNMLKEALKAPQFKYGAAIGQAIGVGAGVPERTIGGTMSTMFSPHYKEKAPGSGVYELVYPGGVWGRFVRGFGIVR